MSEIAMPRKDEAPGTGAALLTVGGLAAAFGVASCCALPLLLATLGISAGWLTGIALLAVPHRNLLLVLSALALLSSAVLLWRQQRIAACATGQPCMSVSARVLILIGLIIGTVLLWAGYTYV